MSCWRCGGILVSYTRGGWVRGSSPFTVMTNIFTIRNKIWDKVIFSEVCVKNSVHGGCLPHCMLGYTPNQRQTPPRADTLPPTDQRQTPHSGADTPCSLCYEIWPTSRQYTSYWNAYLLSLLSRENSIVTW